VVNESSKDFNLVNLVTNKEIPNVVTALFTFLQYVNSMLLIW
jgi:hypothetical protein